MTRATLNGEATGLPDLSDLPRGAARLAEVVRDAGENATVYDIERLAAERGFYACVSYLAAVRDRVWPNRTTRRTHKKKRNAPVPNGGHAAALAALAEARRVADSNGGVATLISKLQQAAQLEAAAEPFGGTKNLRELLEHLQGLS